MGLRFLLLLLAIVGVALIARHLLGSARNRPGAPPAPAVPMARCTWNDPAQIMRLLDAGAGEALTGVGKSVQIEAGRVRKGFARPHGDASRKLCQSLELAFGSLPSAAAADSVSGAALADRKSVV